MRSWKDLDSSSVSNSKHEKQSAELENQQLINQASDYMNSKQWPGKVAIVLLKGEELAQYNLWMEYLDALEAVDTSGAQDINWPESPET